MSQNLLLASYPDIPVGSALHCTTDCLSLVPPCHPHFRLILAGCLNDISHHFSETSTYIVVFALSFCLLHFHPSVKSLLSSIFLPPYWLQWQSHAFADTENIFLPNALTQRLQCKSTISSLKIFCIQKMAADKFMKDRKGSSLSMQGQTPLEDNNKQHDSSIKGSTFIPSKEMQTEATKGACAILPTSEASPTDYILTRHKARFLKKSSNPLISLPSAHSWPALFQKFVGPHDESFPQFWLRLKPASPKHPPTHMQAFFTGINMHQCLSPACQTIWLLLVLPHRPGDAGSAVQQELWQASALYSQGSCPHTLSRRGISSTSTLNTDKESHCGLQHGSPVYAVSG